MSTKANWPELRADKNVMSVEMGGQELWYVRSPQRIEFSIHGEAQQTEARARQICALPKMVAYLRTMAGHTDDCGYESPWAEDAKAILREIGEIDA